MTARRLLLAVSTVALLAGGAAAVPASAGVAVPNDMIVTPNTGPVGTTVVISNAENAPCGGQKGDGPAVVQLDVVRPDSQDVEITIPTDESGNWSIGYLNTDIAGVYTVEGFCADDTQPSGAHTNATDFTYTNATFVITAAAPTTTVAPTTTSTAAAPAAVDATAAFTG